MFTGIIPSRLSPKNSDVVVQIASGDSYAGTTPKKKVLHNET